MEAYLDNLLLWVKEVWRVLKPTGSFVLSIGDCYKQKQFISVSSFAYCRIISETDFVCRNEAPWLKPNVPSPIRSRLKHSHEKLFWFVKDANKYFWDSSAWLREVTITTKKRAEYGRATQYSQGCFARSFDVGECVSKDKKTIENSWRVVPAGERQKGFEVSGRGKQVHIAPFPEALVKPWVESLCPIGGTVLDPFVGSGTVSKVARDLGFNSVGIDLDVGALEYAKKRINWGNGVDGHEYEFKVLIGKNLLG